MLLMFGVGLHFSLDDLLAVRAIALPGALVQIAVATALGAAVAHALGLEPRRRASCSGSRSRSRARWCCCARSRAAALLDSLNGRIAVGWLVVEDLVMVLVLVLLPAARRRWLGGDRAATRAAPTATSASTLGDHARPGRASSSR